MTFGSLFSGIGGLDLGLERAGMQCKWQVEINEFCQKILKKHWPNVPKFRNINDCGRNNLESVALICGGFPCQPFSVAGKQERSADDRALWPEMFRVIRATRPTWVVCENVPGLAHGPELRGVVDDLESEGFSVQCFDLPAIAFGAPHLRHRLFIVAHSNVAEQRHEQGRRWQGWGDGEAEPGHDGTPRPVAHPERDRGEG